MRFLADECLDGRLIDRLRERGLDVATVRDACPGARDLEVLELARHEQRILLTEDKDFGELVLRAGLAACGVVLLRDVGASIDESWAGLEALLTRHAADLHRSFAVLRGKQIRVRRLS